MQLSLKSYPEWLQEFQLKELITTKCILHEQPHIIQLHRPKQKSSLPRIPGIYFIFGSYYTPEKKKTSLDVLTEEYTQRLMSHLGFTQKKEFFQSGILQTGLIDYPQTVEKSKGLLYIGSTQDLSQRVKYTHQVVSAIRRNALAMPYPYAADLRVQVKLLQIDASVYRKIITAIEKEIINLIRPPLNDLPIATLDDPFVYCERLEEIKPVQIFPRELSMDYIAQLLSNSEEAIKQRLTHNLGLEGTRYIL